MILLHCALESDWKQALEIGTYSPTTSISNENTDSSSILCFNPACVTSENFSFPSIQSYMILCINTDKIRNENDINRNTEKILISTPIDINAIIATLDYTFDENDKFVFTSAINDMKIINKSLEKLNITYESHKYFSDGTNSRIFLLNGKYTVKQNVPKLLESEALFSELTDTDKIQHVQYFDEDKKFIIYNFIPGDVMHTVDNFDDLITNIKEIISHYKPYDGKEFGYVYSPYSSWSDFFKNIIHEQSVFIPESFDYLPKVYEAISTLEKYPFEKKLLHGDFGTHNFIKENGKFVGAIDPVPMAGDPLYDLLYALVSNIDIVNHLSLELLTNIANEPEEKVKAMLTIVLFYRLATCIKHHKEDFDMYVDFWYKIIE